MGIDRREEINGRRKGMNRGFGILSVGVERGYSTLYSTPYCRGDGIWYGLLLGYPRRWHDRR